MKNRLSDLNNHLFVAIERLNDEDLEGDKLVEEIKRSCAITEVAEQIISNAGLMLKARAMVNGYEVEELPDVLQPTQQLKRAKADHD